MDDFVTVTKSSIEDFGKQYTNIYQDSLKQPWVNI